MPTNVVVRSRFRESYVSRQNRKKKGAGKARAVVGAKVRRSVAKTARRTAARNARCITV